MQLDKNNPCTKDCPDRPNCKGCERGNAWRKRYIDENKKKQADVRYRSFECDLYQSRKAKSYKSRKGQMFSNGNS